MATSESLTQSDEQAITIQPSAIAAYPGAAEWIPAGGSDAGQDSIGGVAVLHALRRHLLLVLSTGLVCAVAIGAVLYLKMPKKYKATASLELAPANPMVLGHSTSEQSQHVFNEFEVFRDNQVNIIKSERVISAALRDPNLKDLQCLKEADEKHDAIQWLTGEIRVDPSKNGGYISVSATEPQDEYDPSLPPGKPAREIVNAVVNAYMKLVIDAERERREKRLDELQKLHVQKENDVRKKREDLKQDEDKMGVADERGMQTQTQLAVTMYTDFQREFTRMKGEQRNLAGKLKEATRALEELEADQTGAEVPEVEVAVLLNQNPIYRDLQAQIAVLSGISRIHSSNIAQGTKIPSGFNRTQMQFEGAQAQLEALREQTRKMVRDSKLITLRHEKSHYQSELEITTGQLTAFEKQVEQKREAAESAGRITISAQMARTDLESLDRILHNLAEEEENVRVELKSAPRVTAYSAELPEHEARGFRDLFIALGMVFGMLVPAAGIVAWDLRKQRVNSTHDVSKRLRIPVIGAVPRIPTTVMRRLGDASPKSQIWKLRFTESVDGVAARLLRKAECDQCRVVLITSAVSGEGKTTLATQLAMSLARAQRKTVLVDFDLRQPTLDGALGLPLGPGMCEALRGEGDIMGMVQQTETENLSVATAGSWNRQVLPALSNGSVGTVLDQLRANFDFVIIDSSPLLPIVDTRLVCQHVDAVVLSVLRDVSQGTKVLAAHEMLEAFGVRCVEAVVTGGEEHSSAKSLAYQTVMLDDRTGPAGNPTEAAKDVPATEENRQ